MSNRGDGHDKSGDLKGSDENSNVIPLKVPRKKKTRVTTSSSIWGKKEKAGDAQSQKTSFDDSGLSNKAQTTNEPIINLPQYTKYLLSVIIAVHLGIKFLLNADQVNWVFLNLGFIPGRFTDLSLFEPVTLLSPITHMFIHGGWLHIAMNSIMLLAFGAGVEKWVGGKKMIQLFLLCGFFGLLTHFVLNFNSLQPVVGASGSLSGLFAVALVMLNRQSHGMMMRGKYGFLPLIALWVGISILFGLMGSPDGGEIAWAAHVGGFLGGFVALRLLKI